MKLISCKSFLSAVAIALSFSANPALAQKHAGDAEQDIEVISVQGQRPVSHFEREYERAKFAMYEAYNKVNTVRKFTVDCRVVKPIGTQIAKRECLPRFFREESAHAAQMFMLGASAIHADDQQWLVTMTKDEQKAFYAHIAELAKDSPELTNHLVNISNKLAALEERKSAQ